MGGDGVAEEFDVVCCSMEAWDEVWRRNQFLVSEALALAPEMRVLFVEPVVDVPWSVINRLPMAPTGTRAVGDSGRLWALTLRKWLPRRVWPGVDRRLSRQVVEATRRIGFRSPVLWINDSAYAGLPALTDWPVLYDITDDWLLADMPARQLEREKHNDGTLMQSAAEVVVCSPALAASRGGRRPVRLIPNGVDVEYFRRPQDRPADLPGGRVVLYSGTLSSGRLDVDLCVELAQRLRGVATLTLVGPNSCDSADTVRLEAAGVRMLGPKPYQQMPGYLQHADVFAVPHQVNAFTDSLDPIKAREIMAIGRPAVATPVAGFRDLGPPVTVAPPAGFVDAVLAVLAAGPVPPGPGPMSDRPGSWKERAEEFVAALRRARGG